MNALIVFYIKVSSNLEIIIIDNNSVDKLQKELIQKTMLNLTQE